MPVITNEELKKRLEAHNYNCPPITDLTKNVLIRKLAQLDGEKKNGPSNSQKRYKLMEYSSAEEDTSQSNTPRLRRKTIKPSTDQQKLSNSSRKSTTNNGNGHSSRENVATTNNRQEFAKKYGGIRTNGKEAATQRASLMQFSDGDENEEEEDEEEDEEADCDESSEEDDENESNGDEEQDDDRTDFGVQTSFNSTLANSQIGNASRLSDNNGITPTDLRHRRGGNQRFSSSTPVGHIRSTSAYLSPRGQKGHSSPNCSPLAFPPNSPLRRAVAKNKEAFGSLGEALASLPSTQNPSHSNTSIVADSAVSQVSSRSNNNSSDAQIENTNSTSSYRFPPTRRRTSLDYMSVSKIIVTFAITFFGFLLYKYCNLRPRLDIEHKLKICENDSNVIIGDDCINDDMIQPFSNFFYQAVSHLEDHSANVKCLTNQTYSGMELSELEALLRENGNHDINYIKEFLSNMVNIIEENPQYGILVARDSNQIKLQYLYPQVGWLCWLSVTFLSLMSYAKIAVICFIVVFCVAGIVYTVYKLYKWRCEAILREQQDVFELVEQVLSLLMKHHQHQTLQDRSRRTSNRPGVAVNHIRDQLIPPQDRKRKYKIWNKVVSYIRESESRVREDIQVIYGEENKVWQWIPDVQWSPLSHPGPNPYVAPLHMVHSQPSTPMSTSTTSSLSKIPLQSTPKSILSSSSLSSPASRWQGSATRNIGAPCVAPTSCLKVRHLFDDSFKAKGGNWVKQVIDEVLIRCSEANIFHIAVDTQSTEGCVYIKAKNTEDAAKVFKTLHGQWYRGNLVTAKYLRDERYLEKFPDAQYHQTPMQPGNEVNIIPRTTV